MAGGEMLLLVTIVLMLCSARLLNQSLCAIAASVTLLALASLVLAIRGDKAGDGVDRRTRHLVVSPEQRP